MSACSDILTGLGDYDGIVVGQIGQSNDVNISTSLSTYLPLAVQAEMSQGYSYFKEDYDSVADDGSIENYIAGTNDYFIDDGTAYSNPGHFGLSATLIYRLSTFYNKKALAVNTAIPATGMFAGGGWNVADVGNLTDKAIIYMFLPAITKMAAITTRFKFIIVDVHGETDANIEAHANAYYTNKKAQYAYLRGPLSAGGLGMPDLIIIQTALRADEVGPFQDIIRTAQVALANDLPHTYLFDTSGPDYELDATPLHYTNDSLINLGNALADDIISKFDI